MNGLGEKAKRRVAAALSVDREFTDYAVVMDPNDALDFVRHAQPIGSANPEVLGPLIEKINQAIPAIDFGPQHPQTGQAHHTFQVGRHLGARRIVVNIFRGYLANHDDVHPLLERLQKLAEEYGAFFTNDSGPNGEEFAVTWDTRFPTDDSEGNK